MKHLLLNGHGIDIRIEKAQLKIRDGISSNGIGKNYTFKPQRIDIDNVVIYGSDGNITIDGIRWLMKHGVQITILNWDGKLLTTILPAEAVQIKSKFAQYDAYKDNNLRTQLAKNIIRAKLDRTKVLLDYLRSKYRSVNNEIADELSKLDKAKTVRDVMQVEALVAGFYWSEFAKVVPNKWEFESRTYQRKPRGAGDYINCMLNYGYAVLEAYCRKAINSSGMDVHVGFLHEMAPNKYSLAYDMQEPFRFLIDLSIITLIENDAITKKDFVYTENYTLRLKPSGARKVLEEITKQFNRQVLYKGSACTWAYVIVDKTRDMAHYLTGQKKQLNFSDPALVLEREDTEVIRTKILGMTYAEWKKMGYSKGTLHYMKRNARQNKPFKIYRKVKEKLQH